MGTPKTAQVPSSIKHFSNLDLSCQHITTSNFMEMTVAKAMELVPKQSINIDMTTFTRLDPLPQPTFGNADIHNRAYFVPFRTIMKGWNEFIEDTTAIDGDGNPIIPGVPRFYLSSLLDFFMSNGASQKINLAELPQDERDNAYDFVVYTLGDDNDVIKQYIRLTPYGKRCYKLLTSLGYRFPFDYRNGFQVYSFLPLGCLIKVYFDWYFPSAYVDDARANSIRRLIEYSALDDDGITFADNLTGQVFDDVFSEISTVCYDSDYFVSAWDNPVGPTIGSYSNVSFSDPTFTGNIADQRTIVRSSSNNSTPHIGDRNDSVYYQLTQYSIDALKAVTDWMKRKQISGARVLDRYLAEWGITLPAEKLNRSLFIGEDIAKLQFGDVTSTSNGDGAQLGAYAGKGFGATSSRGFVDFSTDEFGYLIIISTIVPKIAYYQGCDRCVSHLTKFDFFRGDFDALGVQAISTTELFVPTGELSQPDEVAGIDYNRAVFGFVPRYAEYKRPYDNMTGDFVLNSKNVGQQGWSLMRDVSYLYNDRADIAFDDIVHSQNFVDGRDKAQYNRIFYVTDNVEDKFKVIHNFVIKSRFPSKPLYDNYEFKDEDKAVKSSIDINGVRAN